MVRNYVDLAFWRYTTGTDVGTEKESTSSSNRFVMCDYVSGAYKSPWSNKTEKTAASVLKWQMTSKPQKFLAKERNRPYPQPVPVQRSKMFIKDKTHCTSTYLLANDYYPLLDHHFYSMFICSVRL